MDILALVQMAVIACLSVVVFVLIPSSSYRAVVYCSGRQGKKKIFRFYIWRHHQERRDKVAVSSIEDKYYDPEAAVEILVGVGIPRSRIEIVRRMVSDV